MTSTVDKKSVYRILKRLCNIISPSGFEEEIRNAVVEELEPYADRLWIDAMGNVIAVKKGGGEGKLMVAAHMDEIGLMIKHITKEGFLKFTPIGGWSERILPGQRVLVKTLKGRVIRGVIGSKPPHIMKPEEAKQVTPMKDLFIDIGVSSREEAEKLGVTVGSIAVIERDVVKLGNPDVVTGRAFDDKVGVVTMIEYFKALDGQQPVDVYVVATVQEEVGLKGARTAAFAISPDLGIALDVTIASDIPGVPEDEYVTRIGKGPAIKIMDGRSGTGLIAHPAIRELLIKTAEEEKIPYQLEVLPGGTTDASAIQLTREGIPAGTISIPTRYIHSPIEVLNLNDVVNAVKLLLGFTKRVNKEWIRETLKKQIK
ncbi:M42 family metallopeptidase [Desulfurococcaceae archaeon MEX13E-LK6-19]|nr:M42 family metallopeptidase [Desulfurococcaceae archaeon MEX13E-LK6-19]